MKLCSASTYPAQAAGEIRVSRRRQVLPGLAIACTIPAE
jgi:hypothetical protein